MGTCTNYGKLILGGSNLNQLYTFLIFILVGMVIGITYDIFRILRKSFRTIDFITYIQDFLFWIITGVILLYSIFTFNNGELRSYIFIGILLGLILYMLSISKFFVEICTKIICSIKKVIKMTFSPKKFIKIRRIFGKNVEKYK